MEITLKEIAWDAKEINFIDSEIFTEGNLIQPPFTWRTLIVIDKNICLFYRTPIAKESGVLRLVRSSQDLCNSESFDQEVIAQLQDLRDLNLRLIDQQENILLSGLWAGDSFKWEVNFPMAKTQKKTLQPEKLMSSAAYEEDILKVHRGVTESIGDWEQRYSDGDAHFCHRVSKDCEDSQAFDCEKCRFGWIEVVDHFCPQGGSKICGRNLCGQRGEPACPRGRSFLEENVDGPCFADSTAGFCEPGLTTSCDENDVLICL